MGPLLDTSGVEDMPAHEAERSGVFVRCKLALRQLVETHSADWR